MRIYVRQEFSLTTTINVPKDISQDELEDIVLDAAHEQKKKAKLKDYNFVQGTASNDRDGLQVIWGP
jgi:hypothetical protein